MSNSIQSDNRHDYDEDILPHLISSYFDDLIDETDSEWAELQSRLKSDKSARSYYAECAVMQAQVAWCFSNELEAQSKVLLPPRKQKFFVYCLVGVPALVVLSVAFLFTLSFESADTSQAVAQVADMVKVTWEKDASHWKRNQQFKAGDQVQLKQGYLELEMTSGARVIVEGPASLEILEEGNLRLYAGRLFAKVPPQAEGFTVITPSAKTIDLGTEFGVYVNDAKTTDVHVMQGLVDSELLNDSGEVLKSKRLVKNKAAQFRKGATKIQEVPYRTEEFVKTLDYDKAVQASSPMVQLKFDEIRNGLVPNQVGDQFHARVSQAENLSGQEINRFLKFKPAGSEVNSRSASDLFLSIESIGKLFSGDFTFELWVRPDAIKHATLFRLYPRPDIDSHYGSVLELMDCSADNQNCFRFLLRNSDLNNVEVKAEIFSQHQYQTDRWYHLVSVRASNRILLYVNGVLLAESPCNVRSNEELGLIIGRHLPPGDNISDRSFLGDMDELLIYRRALSETEIRSHYNLYQTAP
tara:strand:+ start:510 stop:2084 length:1575 start_codon:yes stop_codon:yes gene_type:complete